MDAGCRLRRRRELGRVGGGERDHWGIARVTAGGGKANGPDPDAGGYVPKQVIAFLNNKDNRSLIRGVIAAGNTNFGAEFCYAGDVVSRKCGVPFLYRFELMGTVDDVFAVRAGLKDFWKAASFQEREDTCHPPSLLQSR